MYEPETAGPASMDTVHDLFCADSAGVLGYLRHEDPGLGRRELSILLLSGLMRELGDHRAQRPELLLEQLRRACAVRVGDLG